MKDRANYSHDMTNDNSLIDIRLPMEHRLKIMPEYYQAVSDGVKTFELRKDDRGFNVGDDLILSEWTGKEYTGRNYRCKINYILKDYNGLDPDYAILGIIPCQ